MTLIPGSQRVKTSIALDKDGRVAVTLLVPGWRRLVSIAPTVANALLKMAEMAAEEESKTPLAQTPVRRLKVRRRGMHPLDGRVSRQRLHQLGNVARGLCMVCGTPRTTNALFCDRCRQRKIYLDKGGDG